MTKENTFAVSLTLEDLKRRRLVIPCFQRPYRWSRDEAAVLFDDLMAFLARILNETFRKPRSIVQTIKPPKSAEEFGGFR